MTIAAQAARVAKALRRTALKVVFAESCTGGLVSGALTRIPGISAHHCGGVVVYRNSTKHAYLDIPEKLLAGFGPVSPQTTSFMASSILAKTPEADVSLAVTGHLGPDAPRELDGHVYIAVAWRSPHGKGAAEPTVSLFRCRKADSRVIRQRAAVAAALRRLADELEARKP
jgi:PncC family amidohydrolase